MYRLNITKEEFEEIKKKVFLSEIQEKILEYRLKDYSITKMSQLENCSETTISRELKKAIDKISKVL